MEKRISLSVLLFIILQLAKGQTYIGVEGGCSINDLYTDISNRTSTRLNSGIGYSLGLPIEVMLYPWLSVNVLPSYTRKSYSINRTDSLSGIYSHYNNGYFQLPVLIRFHYGGRLQVSPGLGGYIGYWSDGNIKGAIPDIYSAVSSGMSQAFHLTEFDHSYSFDNIKDRRWELGWTASIRGDYKLTDRYKIFMESSFYYALTSQQKEYAINQIPQYNHTLVLAFGFLYQIK